VYFKGFDPIKIILYVGIVLHDDRQSVFMLLPSKQRQ